MTITNLSIGGRPIYRLRFDDIDFMGGSRGELQDLMDRLVDRTRAVEWESSEKKARS